MRIILFAILITPVLALAQQDQSLYSKYKPDQHEWSYEGPFGPLHWAEFDEYSNCSGMQQSPINIIPSEALDFTLPISPNYRPFLVDLINNGHTLIEKVVEIKAITINNDPYSLIQFHFHTPSEHHIAGVEYPMEIHFVHMNSLGTYAVVGVLIEEGDVNNPFLAHFMNSLPAKVNEEIKSSEQADLYECLPKDKWSFYYYEGSLTTPPCTEGIKWIVLDEPIMASHDQIESIHEIIHDDNRPIQPLNSRPLYHCVNKPTN